VLRTGDLAFAMSRKGKARIIGADFAHTMLVRANAKAATEVNGRVSFWIGRVAIAVCG